jgi:DNA-binding response OmpR family regulator
VRILFVENHAEFTASVVRLFLAAHDVDVVPAIASAKEKVQTSNYDAVLVDYDLDDGKGDELVRWLRTTRGHWKIVAVSARDTGNEALMSAGADVVCSKLRFSQIETVLQELGRRE